MAALPVTDDRPAVRGPRLSPSRASDFKTCPLLFRFRVVDRLEEAPGEAAVRGTVVHAALDGAFDLAPADRTPDRVRALLAPALDTLVQGDAAISELVSSLNRESFLSVAGDLVDTWFRLEDPSRLSPAAREQYVECRLDSGLTLRGIVDRVDRAPDGSVRVVDYKGLDVATPLPTPTGWTTMGAVRVGDQLLGADGRPCLVTAKSDLHARPCYRVTFDDRTSIVADHVHLWRVETDRGVAVLSTEQLRDNLRSHKARGQRHLRIPNARPLELPEGALPIDPYVLGVWLGDGKASSGEVTSFDEEVFSEVGRRGHAAGRGVRADGSPNPTRTLRGLRAALRRSGLLGHKAIPPEYLRASRRQRLDLLRGLMDTDGSWNAGRKQAVFVNTNKGLAHGVAELVASLGWRPYTYEYRATGFGVSTTAYKVTFASWDDCPFHLPRKASAWVPARPGAKSRRRIVVAVEPVPSVPTQCIQVDSPDSLYLCGSQMVPTHNTGRAPGHLFEQKALFQVKFYATVLWRSTGVVPTEVMLVYLASGERLRHRVDPDSLPRFEAQLPRLWEAIERAARADDFRAKPGKLCDWCDHRDLCPAWGNTPPPMPEDALDRLLGPTDT